MGCPSRGRGLASTPRSPWCPFVRSMRVELRNDVAQFYCPNNPGCNRWRPFERRSTRRLRTFAHALSGSPCRGMPGSISGQRRALLGATTRAGTFRKCDAVVSPCRTALSGVAWPRTFVASRGRSMTIAVRDALLRDACGSPVLLVLRVPSSTCGMGCRSRRGSSGGRCRPGVPG